DAREMRLPRSSKYWSEADGRAVIEAWRRSGESRSAFARRHGLQTKRLKYWAERLSRADGPARTLALVSATVVGAGLSAVLRAGSDARAGERNTGAGRGDRVRSREVGFMILLPRAVRVVSLCS
ncbi:MAG: hypothetical protein ABIY55_01665, partial [Kofleriaceae bacterium]